MADFEWSAELLQSIVEQEEQLVFEEFSHAVAIELGMALYKEAQKRGLAVTIDVRKGRQIIFHLAMEGRASNNDRWVERKSNTVQIMQKSSLRVGCELALEGETLFSRHFLDPAEYTALGGSFPVRVANCGVIGAVTVSGLPHQDDHALVVDVLREII
jgi:uncharacterized protein (UPF0303 family)